MLLEIHHQLSNMVAIYALLAGAFCAFYFLTRRPVDGNLRGVLGIGEGLFAVQVLMGLLLWVTGAPTPARLELHILYGLSSVLTLPLVATLTRNRNAALAPALFSVACFFIWGLAQRAVETAAH